MTIQQCKYVLEILKRGSFNEASKALFVAQSSLSASVKSLEEELHIKIFERSNSGIYLTGDGAEFVRYASHIVQQNDLVEEQLCAVFDMQPSAETVPSRSAVKRIGM